MSESGGQATGAADAAVTAEGAAQAGDLNAYGAPAASKLGQYSWTLYDWANQPYYTVIGTFIFIPYFYTGIVGDPVRAQEIHGWILGLAGLFIATLSPVLGSIADAGGTRKPWILWMSALHIIVCAALWFGVPGADGGIILLVAVCLIMASVTMEMATVFTNAMLPSIAPANRIGFLSGFGFGMGYLSGLASILFVLVFFSLPATTNLTFVPETPLFGLDPGSHEHDRVTGPFAVVWYVIFVLPFFLFVPDRPGAGLKWQAAVNRGVSRLWATIRRIREYKNVALFLFARMIYNDGLAAIFAFGTAYAVGTFGWTGATAGIFGLILLVFAAAGAFMGGWLDDRLGSKRTIIIAVIGLIVGTLGGISATKDSILFGLVQLTPVDPARPLMSGPELFYIFFGIIIGMGAGPAQAASRTMMSRLTPRGMESEFFGLYALSGKATAFLAPLLIGVVTAMAASQRAGMAVILVFLVAGLLLVLPVREERAHATH